MHPRRWLPHLAAQILAAIIAAMAGILENVISSDKHPHTDLIVGLVALVLCSAIFQTVAHIINERQGDKSNESINNVKDTADQILQNQQDEQTARAGHQLEQILASIPEVLRSWIKDQWTKDPHGVQQVLEALSESGTSPPVVVQQWQHLPEWLKNLSWRSLLVAGELANAYDAPKVSSELFLAAVRSGCTREQYWTARAALLLRYQDEAQAAAQILDNQGIDEHSSDKFSQVVYFFIRGDMRSMGNVLDQWMPETSIDVLLAGGIRAVQISEEMEKTIGPTPSQFRRISNIYRDLIEKVPGTSSARINLANILTNMVEANASLNRHRDMSDALEYAIQARDLCRAVKANSVPAVELACRAAYVDMRYNRVIEIGTTVIGEASAEEAESEVVRRLVASSALATGKINLGNNLIEEICDPFYRALLHARSAEAAGQPSTELWMAAREQARDPAELAQALHGLARIGNTELPGIEQIRAELPHEAAVIEAVSAAAAGDSSSAIRKLRTEPGTDFSTVLTLASLYLQANNIDAAVSTLREGASVLNEPRLRMEAVQALRQAERFKDAKTELEALLADSGNDQGLRHDCLGLLGQWASDQGDFVTAQARFIELVSLDPRDSQARWALIFTLLFRGLTSEAHQIYDSAPGPLEITSPDRARAWMAMKAATEHSDVAQFVEEVITLARRFPDNEDVQVEAIFAVLSPYNKEYGPLPPQTQARFNQHFENFFKKWPNSTRLRRFKADDIQELVKQMEDLVRPTQEVKTLRADIADRVANNTLPWAILSAITGRSYSEIVVVRAGGILPARHIDTGEQQLCCDAARAALDTRVVLDISAAAVLITIPEVRDLLASQFERLIVSEGERLDATRARDFLAGRSTSSWGYDEESDRGRLIDFSEEIANQRYQKAVQLSELLNACVLSSVTSNPHLDELKELATSSWATAVESAVHADSAFWCDEVALRGLARSVGVQTFSTPSLLDVMVERGILSPGQRESAVRKMIEESIGDFPLDRVRLSTLVSRSGGVAGPIASIFSRSVSWGNVQSTYEIWIALVEQVSKIERKYAADWLYLAVIGIARPQATAALRREAAALLLSGVISLIGDDANQVARCVAATRSGLAAIRREVWDDDPLARSVFILRTTLSRILDLPQATSYLSGAFSQLDATDRITVLQVLYS